MATSDTPKSTPAEQYAHGQQAHLEGDHARERVARVRAVPVRERDGQQDEAESRAADPHPLAGAALEAEEALGEDGEEDEATGDHGLDDRQRSHGQGGDVEDPGADGHQHADGEPLGAEEADRALQGMADADLRGGAGAAMLQEKANVRGERAENGKQDAEFESHTFSRRG
jgi:hypothetical protein